MSLVPDYDDSSNSSNRSSGHSSNDETISTTTEDTDKGLSQKRKLPTPNFGSTENVPTEGVTSVFKNPFLEAENAKEAILQKHVKMVESKDKIEVINGKKICWNYRKGRCRFGHNCKFAHDSDIQKTEEQLEAEKHLSIKNSTVCQNVPLQCYDDSQAGDNDDGMKKKRKRPGLSQGLVPGKKVMKQFYHQKT